MSFARTYVLSLLFVSLPVAALAGVSFPTQETGTRIVPRDKTTFILTVFNCFKVGGVGGGSFFANHGTVTFSQTSGTYCAQPNFPAARAFYTPNPGFVGEDDVQVYFGRAPFHMKVFVRDGVAQPRQVTETRPRRNVTGSHGGSGGN
jgi:hypothetical protein